MRQIIKEYIRDIFHWWWVIAIGIFGGVGSYIFKIWPGFLIPRWVWIGLPVLGLIIAQFLAYKRLWVKLEKNWVRAYMTKYWNLPPVPSFMSDLVLNYSLGMLVSKNMQLINPSAQFWKKLRVSDKEKLLQLVEWLGQDPRDYEASIKMMSPPGGTSMRLHRK